MALVFVAHNGIGLGHLSRAIVLCDWFAERSTPPIIFSQSLYGPELQRFPGRKIPTLYKVERAEREVIEADIIHAARLSQPAVVVEDTHLSRLRFPSDIKRILIVRPTSFEHISWMNDLYAGEIVDRFLIADAPNSPTWPYDAKQTRRIRSWKHWSLLGPVYRTPSHEAIKRIRDKYRAKPEGRICIYSMGGGGVHSDNDPDMKRFIAVAKSTRAKILGTDNQSRHIFVKGPLWNGGLSIPDGFECIEEEVDMPALLSVAHGAVIRAGFNTTWESIHAGIPFKAISGTVYKEPLNERLLRLKNKGLLVDSLSRIWLDEKRLSDHRKRCVAEAKKFPGQPEKDPLSLGSYNSIKSVLITRRSYGIPSYAMKALDAEVRSAVNGSYWLRVDDVSQVTSDLQWLVRKTRDYGCFASLQIIPYLFTNGVISVKKIINDFVEVGQHGYSHVVRCREFERRSEFSLGNCPSKAEIDYFRTGYSRMLNMFGSVFTGGFSAPYDLWSDWIPQMWANLGGRFLSVVRSHPSVSLLPVVENEIDLWNWQTQNPVTQGDVTARIIRQFRKCNRVGLLVHAQHLHIAEIRKNICQLLEVFERSSLRSAPQATASLRPFTTHSCFDPNRPITETHEPNRFSFDGTD